MEKAVFNKVKLEYFFSFIKTSNFIFFMTLLLRGLVRIYHVPAAAYGSTAVTNAILTQHPRVQTLRSDSSRSLF